MVPTRRTQPYRAGAREPGPVLDAMQRGRSPSLGNPMDVQRAAQTRPKAAHGHAKRGLGHYLMSRYYSA